MIASSCEDLAKIFFRLNYNVYAVCKYKSLNLEKYCYKILIADFHEDKKILNFIKLIKNNDDLEFLIGSGFSESLEKELPLNPKLNKGNSIHLHKKIKSKKFFSDLKKNKICIPPWTSKRNVSKNYVIKDFKSFGGNMIKKYETKIKLNKSQYFQKLIEGEHISIQFLSKNLEIKILSICKQLFRKNHRYPFIIESIVSKRLNRSNINKLYKICLKISRLYNLNGINNLDLVWEFKTKKFFVIELNARPGLSTHIIYSTHKEIYKECFEISNYKNSIFFFGTHIIYSNKKITLDKKKYNYIKTLEFNNNFSELPHENDVIEENEPICLVHCKSKKFKILRDKLKKISYKFITKLELPDGEI